MDNEICELGVYSVSNLVRSLNVIGHWTCSGMASASGE